MGCKIGKCVNELYGDIEILSETWGCNCEKHFKGCEMIALTEPQKREGVKKGHNCSWKK